MTGSDINDLWRQNACAASIIGDPLAHYEREPSPESFDRSAGPRILANLAEAGWRGKRVLEIGLSQGLESEELIRRGAIYSGVELSESSVRLARMRLKIKGLGYDTVRQADLSSIPFEDDAFDLVLSKGVLQHVPDIKQASAEIARVLKPDGELIAILYAKRSFNYLVLISVVRRLRMIAAYLTGARGNASVAENLHSAKEMGLFNYLAMRNFIHSNTDGPLNQYSKVYTLSEVEKDFPDFSITRSYRSFIHARVSCLPLESVLGWHLWVHLSPKKGVLS